MPQVIIKEHPTSPDTHKLVMIVHKGRVYASAWAEPFPTKSDAIKAWKDDRKAFLPFDESTGKYL